MKKTIRQAIGLSALSSALCINVAFADQLLLKNGDIITGEILNKDAASIKLKTSYAGTITIAWKDIANVKADKPIDIMLDDNSIVHATITPTETGKSKLEIKDNETSSDIPLAKIKFINPTPLQSGIGVVWTGNVNVSGAITQGNADTSAIRLAAETVARTKRNRFTLGAAANKAENNSNDTEKNMRGYLQYDHFLDENWYAYVNGSAEYDQFRDIQLRSRVGSGAGYHVYKTPVVTLDIEAGISYVNTDFFVAEDTSAPAARWALKYNRKLFDGNVVAFHNHQILFGIEDLNESLIFTQTGLRFPIISKINATTQLNIDYARTPAAGRKPTDTTFLFGLGYGW